MHKIRRLLKHLWLDEADTRRAIPADMLERLKKRISASEARHAGQIRIYVEAALPRSYLWRPGPAADIAQLTRQRAITMFGKLRIWDTEQNNGVLIYLLLAEHLIEVVADRGLDRKVPQDQWQAMTARMGQAFGAGRFEDGLTQALEEVSALLMDHFPAEPGALRHNELPDEPLVS